MGEKRITVQTTISSKVEKVWDFWTKPEHIVKWNFASNDWHCPAAENDLRTGGKFKSTMASKDGKMSFDFEGIYDEVIECKRIAYSLADERKVIVVFEELGDKTKVTETFDPENENSEELQRSGWQSIMDNFKSYVEK